MTIEQIEEECAKIGTEVNNVTVQFSDIQDEFEAAEKELRSAQAARDLSLERGDLSGFEVAMHKVAEQQAKLSSLPEQLVELNPRITELQNRCHTVRKKDYSALEKEAQDQLNQATARRKRIQELRGQVQHSLEVITQCDQLFRSGLKSNRS